MACYGDSFTFLLYMKWYSDMQQFGYLNKPDGGITWSKYDVKQILNLA
jgi:hypothetical protein